MIINTREEIIELTQEWKGERLEDGRVGKECKIGRAHV